MDEEAVARLIYFFSEQGSRKQNGTNSNTRGTGGSSSSTLVQTLTDNQGKSTPDGDNWNLPVVQEVLSQDYSSLSWEKIAQKCDFRGFLIRNIVQFDIFLKLYLGSAKMTFPFEVVVGRWENRSGQLSMIESALSVSPSIYRFPLTEDEAIDASTVGILLPQPF